MHREEIRKHREEYLETPSVQILNLREKEKAAPYSADLSTSEYFQFRKSTKDTIECYCVWSSRVDNKTRSEQCYLSRLL